MKGSVGGPGVRIRRPRLRRVWRGKKRGGSREAAEALVPGSQMVSALNIPRWVPALTVDGLLGRVGGEGRQLWEGGEVGRQLERWCQGALDGWFQGGAVVGKRSAAL